MALVRNVKQEDYDFIYNSIENFNHGTFLWGYVKYAMDDIINQKNSQTIVYEEDGIPKAYYTLQTYPANFMKRFFSNMTITKKILYDIKMYLNQLENKTNNANIEIPQEYQDIINNIYKKDCNCAKGLFAYSIAKRAILPILINLSIKKLESNFRYFLFFIKKSNQVSLIMHQISFGKFMKQYDYDKESYMYIVDIEEYKNKVPNFENDDIIINI